MKSEEFQTPAFPTRRRWLWSVLAAVAILASLVFVGVFVREHWDEVRRVPAGFDVASVAAYLALTLVYFVFQGLVWKLMYTAHGYPIGVRRIMTMYASAILLAYIPGKFATSVGIAALAKSARVPASVSVYLFLRAQVLFLIGGVAAVVTICFFVPDGFLLPETIRRGLLAVLVAGLAAALALHHHLRRWLEALLRLTRVEATIVPVTRFYWLRDLGLLYASWFLNGFAFWWLVRACAGEVGHLVPFAEVCLILVMSYLGAYAAVFVPAGMGILEAELIVGLDLILEAGAAVWVAIGHRMLTVTLGGLLLLVLLALGGFPRRGEPDS